MPGSGKYCSKACRYPPRPCKARAPRPEGSTTDRGYGHQHQQLRDEWKAKVEAGQVTCWRPNCRRRIMPGEPWDLGHDDHDKSVYRGPEHRRCNRRAGAIKANQSRRRPRQLELIPVPRKKRRRTAPKVKTKVVLPQRECSECGTTFNPRRRDHVTCGAECRRKRNTRKILERYHSDAAFRAQVIDRAKQRYRDCREPAA